MSKLEIHPFTIKRTKLDSLSFFESSDKNLICIEIESLEEQFSVLASNLADEISYKLTYRSNEKKKLIRSLKKLSLDYSYRDFESGNKKIQMDLEKISKYTEKISEKRAVLRDMISADYELNRNNLKRIYIENKNLYNSIYMINPEIYPRLDKYLNEDCTDDVDLRKLELVLTRIATRAITKTSPIGKLNKVSILGNYEKNQYQIYNKQITVNNVFLFYLYEKFLLDDEIIVQTKFRINTNYFVEDNYINIVNQEAGLKKVFKTKDKFLKVPINIYIQQIIKDRKKIIDFDYLTCVFNLDKATTIKLMEKIYDIGLIMFEEYFSDSLDSLQNLVSILQMYYLSEESKWWTLIELLGYAEKELQSLNSEFVHEKRKRIIETFVFISEKFGIELFPANQYLYEDYLVEDDEISHFDKQLLEDIQLFLEIYAVFDINTRIQMDVIEGIKEKYKSNVVSIKDGRIFGLIADVNMAHNSYWLATWDKLNSNSEKGENLENLKCQFKDFLFSQKNSDTISIPSDFIRNLKEEIPENLRKNQVSYSFFYQKCNEDIVVNKIYVGYMSFHNRFLRYTDIPEKNRKLINDIYLNKEFTIAEIYETFGFNANVHTPSLNVRITSDLTRDKKQNDNYQHHYKMEDMYLKVVEDKLLLEDEKGKLFKPVVCNSMIRVLYPGYLSFYSTLFSNVSHINEMATIFLSDLKEEHIRKCPRICFGKLILERARYLFYTSILKEVHGLDNFDTYLFIRRFCRNNKLPYAFYFQVRNKNYKDNTIKSISREFEKPQYFDLENILLLKIFLNALRTSEMILISEVLPAKIDACEYLSEFVLN